MGLVGVFGFTVDAREQRVVREPSQDHGEQMQLVGKPGVEAFRQRGVPESPPGSHGPVVGEQPGAGLSGQRGQRRSGILGRLARGQQVAAGSGIAEHGLYPPGCFQPAR